MSPVMRQTLVLLACTGGLATLLGQLNHGLAFLAVTLFVPGLLICFAALRLPLGTGLAVALLTGLWLDAASPGAFGRQAALLGLAFCLLYRVRTRLPREETLVGVVAAVFINLALFIVVAVTGLNALPDPGSGALRLLVDLLVSQLATILLGPWFFALQTRALELVGAPLPSASPNRYA
jgi:rod shape-determining protein MreD